MCTLHVQMKMARHSEQDQELSSIEIANVKIAPLDRQISDVSKPRLGFASCGRSHVAQISAAHCPRLPARRSARGCRARADADAACIARPPVDIRRGAARA